MCINKNGTSTKTTETRALNGSTQDNKLEEQILAVNSEIKKLNKENHQEAPEFNSDLYRTSNRQKKTYALFGDRVSSNCCICL
jgi:hypothetical protein